MKLFNEWHWVSWLLKNHYFSSYPFPMDKNFKCWKFVKLMCQRMPIRTFLKKSCIMFLDVCGLCCGVQGLCVEHRFCAVAYRHLFSCGTRLCSGQAQSRCSGPGCPTAHGTLVHRTGIKPFTCAGRRVPNHWTTKEVPDKTWNREKGSWKWKTRVEVIENIVCVNILNFWGIRNCAKESQIKLQNTQK